MAHSDACDNSFPFFRLPLELREAVYSLLSTPQDVADITVTEVREEFVSVLFHSPEPQAYLVCRQSKAELQAYLSRVKSQKLTVRDQSNYKEWPRLRPACGNLALPPEACLITTCSGNRWGRPCQYPEDCAAGKPICWHTNGLQGFCKRHPQLLEVQVSLYVSWDEADQCQWPDSRHGEWLLKAIKLLTATDKLSNLRVYKVHARHMNDLEGDYDLRVSWRKEEGWKVPEQRPRPA